MLNCHCHALLWKLFCDHLPKYVWKRNLQNKTRVNFNFCNCNNRLVFLCRYIVTDHCREVNLQCVSQNDKHKLDTQDDDTDAKKPKLSKKQKLRGQNKSRGPTFRVEREKELCSSLINLTIGEPVPQCERKNCVFLHDVDEYLKIKPKDIGSKLFGVFRKEWDIFWE